MNAPVFELGKGAQLKLFFQSFQFTVSGTLTSVARLQNGVQKIQATIDFAPELVSIIEQYRFAERFVGKVAVGKLADGKVAVGKASGAAPADGQSPA
jgi:hypothetical protein